jgi:hypothetical protein
MDERPPQPGPPGPHDPLGPLPPPRPGLAEGFQVLGGVVAGLAAGIGCGALTVATLNHLAGAMVMTVALITAAYFVFLQARKRELAPFLRGFFIALSVALLLCSACSGVVSMMGLSGTRIGG